jgi:hypothetical protein
MLLPSANPHVPSSPGPPVELDRGFFFFLFIFLFFGGGGRIFGWSQKVLEVKINKNLCQFENICEFFWGNMSQKLLLANLANQFSNF